MSRSIVVFTIMLLVFMSSSALAADSVCIECHGELPDHLGAPVGEWQDSVHAENGISCHDCHGGDPTDSAMAKSPDRGFIGAPEYTEVPDFCGRCHVGIADAYRKGAHGQAIEAGGAQCVICHGNHSIEQASLDLISEEQCSMCHEYERAALIKLSLKETDEMILDVEQDLERLYRLGFAIDEMQGSLFNQRNVYHRIFHGVDVERVRKETAGVQAEVGKIINQVNELDTTIGKRKLWGSVVIGLFVLAGVVLMLVRKAYEEDEKS